MWKQNRNSVQNKIYMSLHNQEENSIALTSYVPYKLYTIRERDKSNTGADFDHKS